MDKFIHLLRDKCVPELSKKYAYFTLQDIQLCLTDHKISVSLKTLNNLRLELIRKKNLYDAGRGWLTRIREPFDLPVFSLKSFITEINKTFPGLDFYCWSTEQVKGLVHHSLANFVIFLNVPRYAMLTVYERLSRQDYQVHLNPTMAEASKGIQPGHRTIVIRPSVFRSSDKKNILPPESVLVDLFVENHKLHLIASSDFQDLLNLVLPRYRISVSRLFSYALRRTVSLTALLGDAKRNFSGINLFRKSSLNKTKDRKRSLATLNLNRQRYAFRKPPARRKPCKS